MLTNNKQGLLIFVNLSVDFNLPKHQKKTDNSNINDVTNFVIDTSSFSTSSSRSIDYNQAYFDYLINRYVNLGESWTVMKLKLKRFIYKYVVKFNESDDLKKTINVDSLKLFFNDVMNSISEIDKSEIDEILSKYEILLNNAKINHQIALFEKITEYSSVLKTELLLCGSGFNKYVTEDDIVKFHHKASKHETLNTALCLTYIQNFVKVIPEEVSALKRKADELKVFDNYVILHYDYDGSAVEDTKAEKEKKKDPILFGVIKGSNRLYFIGDWVDDYCDLTLDVLIKTLGKSVDMITVDSINKSLSEL